LYCSRWLKFFQKNSIQFWKKLPLSYLRNAPIWVRFQFGRKPN